MTRPARLAADGRRQVAEDLGTALDRLPAVPAPAMRLVPLPAGALTASRQVNPFDEAPSRQVEPAPVPLLRCWPGRQRAEARLPRRRRLADGTAGPARRHAVLRPLAGHVRGLRGR